MSGAHYPVPSEVLSAVRGARRVLLATHENPDADGFGSLVACGLALPGLGVAVARLGSGTLPTPLDELPGVDQVPLDDGESTYDLAILFDCHSASRLGVDAAALDRCVSVLVVDHHPAVDGDAPAGIAWIVDDAPATTLLARALLLEMGGAALIDARVASNLYAGLVVDTGGFRHSSTSAAALRQAAELVDAGADAHAITELFLHRRSPAAMRLLAAVLGDLRYEADDRIVLLAVSRQLLERCGARLEEAEALVSMASAVAGVDLAVMYLETAAGKWRISLRARVPWRVDEIAREHGGGGHVLAAGFRIEGNLEELQDAFLPRLRAELAAGEARR